MLQEQQADLWALHAQGWYPVDPINLTLDKEGRAVMGGGISRQVRDRYPGVPTELGLWITTYTVESVSGCPLAGRAISAAEATGRLVFWDRKRRLIYLPTKYDWRAPSDVALIDRGLGELAKMLLAHPEVRVAIPRLGAGLGGLDWHKDVFPLVQRHLDRPGLSGRVLLVSLS